MNIFNLAYKQLEREGKLNSNNEFSLMLDRAVLIRKFLDKQLESKARNQFKKVS
jgi:hypothetical protein